jgi:ABC-type phosphate/phosphonate transport system substrate-binding protein
MQTAKSALVQKIAAEKSLSEDLRAQLRAAMMEFKEKYIAERTTGST